MSAFVYVISASEFMQKIGIADDPRGRLIAMQTGCPLKLSLALTYETRDAFLIEQRAHKLFADHRIRGEWFAVSVLEALHAVTVAALGQHESFSMDQTRAPSTRIEPRSDFPESVTYEDDGGL